MIENSKFYSILYLLLESDELRIKNIQIDTLGIHIISVIKLKWRHYL